MPREREVERGRHEPHAKAPGRPRDESEYELNEDDEEFQELAGDSSLEEGPVPEDEQEANIERESGALEEEGGPPRRDRLTAMADEIGRWWLHDATETDPVERLEDEQEDRYRAADSELDIRRSSRWSGTRDIEEEKGDEGEGGVER